MNLKNIIYTSRRTAFISTLKMFLSTNNLNGKPITLEIGIDARL